MDRLPTTARLHNSEEFRAQFAIYVLHIADRDREALVETQSHLQRHLD